MSRRRTVLATLAAIATLLLGTAGPGRADDAPVITISDPGSGAVLGSSEVTLRGGARMTDVNRITAVTVTVTRLAGGNLERDDCWAPDPAVLTGAKATFSCTFGLDYNGPHVVTVRATGEELVELNGPESREARTSFKVEVPPAAPQDVRVEVGPDRRVTISWARNTEPDLRSYRVSRLAPGSAVPSVITTVPQPQSGERVSAVDGAVPPAGGPYHYVVTALRPDRDGRVSDRAIAQSSPATVEVAAMAAAGGPPGPGLPSPGARTAPNIPSLLGGVPTSLALPEGAALPADDGFSSGDPFALPGGDGSESADPAVLDDSPSVSNQRALVVPIAAGLLLCVLALHLRRYNRTVLASPPAYYPIVDSDRGSAHDDHSDAETAVLVGAARPRREG